jgi:CheY-like chemotaxis protein
MAKVDAPVVLAVGDDTSGFGCLDEFADELGFEVLRATSSHQAIREVSIHACAALLIDQQVLGDDAQDVAAFTRANPATRDLPIVVITARKVGDWDGQKQMRWTGIDVVKRPVAPDALRQWIHAFTELFQLRREVARTREHVEKTIDLLESAHRDWHVGQSRMKASQRLTSISAICASLTEELQELAQAIPSDLGGVLRDHRAPPLAAREAEQPDSDRTVASILVVEDDDDLRRVVGRILRAQGYEVIECQSPAEAKQACSEHGRIDLLLTDCVMPEVQGPELAWQLTQMFPELRTLYMSGHPRGALSSGDKVQVIGPLIPKPFTPELLAERVKAALAGVAVREE